MCDYDGSYEPISSRDVVIRKPQQCGSCLANFPAGTRMGVHVGKTEGEIGRTYACAACTWASKQEDETLLHLCWGWAWDGGDYDDHGDPKRRWQYIHDTLAAGGTPTEDGYCALPEPVEEDG